MAIAKKQASGPRYSVDVVSRDTYNRKNIGDDHNGRRVVEGFFDPELGNYCLVTTRKEPAA